jgi:hypothetical protein
MNRRYHIPSQISWHEQFSDDEKARVRHAVLSAIARAVEEAATDRTEIVQVSSRLEEEPGERFEPSRFHSESESYSVPSYDDHGAPTQLPVRSAPQSVTSHASSGSSHHAQAPRRGSKQGQVGRRIKQQRTPAIVETRETAHAVLSAIIDIVNQYVQEREGFIYPRTHPSHHKDIPDRYMPLLHEWFQITHGDVRQSPQGPVVSTHGVMLQSHIAHAMSQTRPLIDVLLHAEPVGTSKWLNEQFYVQVEQFKQRALSEEVFAAIESAAGVPAHSAMNLAAMTEEEKLKLGVAEALTTIRLLNTILNRHLTEEAAGLAKRVELEQLFRKLTAQAIQEGELPRNDVLQPILKMNLAGALLFIKGGLDGMNAVLAVSDPVSRAKLLAEHHTFFGVAVKGTAILTLLGQFLHGAVAAIGAITYSISSLLGKTEIAMQVLSKGIPALANMNFVLNAIGVVHGFAVLLDYEASGEEKAKAVLEIGISGAGVMGRFIAGVSLPATLSVVINFYTVRAVLEKGAEAYLSLIQLGLNSCFADMRETAHYVSATATRLAIAAEMSRHESNLARKVELDKQVGALHWNLAEFFLKPYIKRATTSTGATNKDPGAYGPALTERFKPLADREMATPDQALQAAAEFIQIVARCFAEPEKILEKAARWAWQTGR